MIAAPPDGIEIRSERPEEYAAIGEVVRTAFAHHQSVAQLVDLIRASPQYLPSLALVGLDDGTPVGHVMISRAELDDGGTRRGVLTLSPLAVAPAWQRRGIGGRLVREALARAEGTGEALVMLEGSPRYYPRFGFRPAGEFGVTIELPDWAPPEAAMAYPLTGYRPEFRGQLVYPPAFSAID